MYEILVYICDQKLPDYFRDMFKYNHEVHDIGTRSHDQLHL